jgi:GNAT superfamily N-acetyltransferase
VCSTAHDVDFGTLFSLLPADGLHVTACSADALVGHAVMTTRWCQPEGASLLRTAYVDAVAVAPAWQGHGIGTAVMRRVADACDAEGFALACLQSDLRGFYESLGWATWHGPLRVRNDTGIVSTPDDDGIYILRLAGTPTLDLDGTLTITYDGRSW